MEQADPHRLDATMTNSVVGFSCYSTDDVWDAPG